MAEVPNQNPENQDNESLFPKDQFTKEAAERASREWSKRIQAENEREEKALRLAANEARTEARKQRRGSSVSAAEDLADAKERKELKEYFRKSHKLGSYSFDKKDKDVDLTNKKGVKLEGTTDANWFDLNKKRPASWYKELADDAVKIKELRGHIKTNLTPDVQAKMDKLIDVVLQIRDVSGDKTRFDHDKWNDILMSQAGNKDDVLGSQGLYNYILAFRRAASKKDGKKTVRRDLSEKDFNVGPDGKVKFDSINLNLAGDKKGSKFRETVISGYDDAKMPEVKENGEFEKSIADMNERLSVLLESYRAQYGAKIDFVQGKNDRGNYLFTMKCDVGLDKPRNFHVRLIKSGEKVKYSLMEIPLRDSLIYDSSDEAYKLVKAKMDALFKSFKDSYETNKKDAVEKENGDFKKNLDDFFEGHYLKSKRAVEINKQVDGVYSGVKVEGASYGIHMANEQYFVFVNPDFKSLSVKSISETSRGKFELVTVWFVSSLNLSAEKTKEQFAEKLVKNMETFQMEEEKRRKSY